MRQAMLDKIDEIQDAELGNVTGDDVVDLMRSAISSIPTEFNSRSLGVSSTTQGTLDRPLSFTADYDAEGMPHFSVRMLLPDFSTFTRSTRDDDVSFNSLNDIPALGWKGVEMREESGLFNETIEVFSDVENNEDTDYLAMGFWLRESTEKTTTPVDYRLHFGAGGNDPFVGDNLADLTGTATYQGPATGLHMKQDAAGVPVFDYFNATASLTAEFDDSTDLGDISGSIT